MNASTDDILALALAAGVVATAITGAELAGRRQTTDPAHVGATDTTVVLPTVQAETGYVGRHRDPRQAGWRPMHTRAAARRRGQHTRPAGQRPDRRIEKTVPLTLDRIDRILAEQATT